MYLSSIKIQNYKVLKDVKIDLSSFVCMIGENNAGKSSTLQALNSFIEDSKISKKDFYDHLKPIRIEVQLSEINEKDLEKISETHRDRIREIIVDETIKLIKIFNINEKPKIFTEKLMPNDERFGKEKIDEIVKGKRGTAIKEAMQSYLPEYNDYFDSVSTQKNAKEAIDLIIGELSPEKLDKKEVPLPPGIPTAINSLLPTPILIPAVKDINDDVKTKDSSTFGKLIGVLLGAIEDTEEFRNLSESLNDFNKMLNRVDTGEGIIDERIDELKRIEELVNQYLNENFQNADLQIGVPKPELKKVFSGAEICINDGARGLIETKGDGLKRAVTFALLRSYVEIKRQNSAIESENFKYLILFEEPELYMHPAAQKILFEALCDLSEANQVLVTTHSPIFFSGDYIGTFVKMKKENNIEGKPFSRALHVDVKEDMENRDLFKMLCFENNNAAFFSDKVVLVEGESDQIFFNHIAKKLNSNWDFNVNNIPMIQIAGKGSLKRYRDFFESFDINVHAIIDLDVIPQGFEKVGADENATRLHSKLMQEIDKIIKKEKIDGSLSASQIRDLIKSYDWRKKYDRLIELSKKIESLTKEEKMEIELLFSKESTNQRKIVLQNYEVQYKEDLLNYLREKNVYILSKGAVEAYYPEGVEGRDKLSKAFNVCDILNNSNQVKDICPKVSHNESEISEFEAIFSNIFR